MRKSETFAGGEFLPRFAFANITESCAIGI